MCKSYISYYLCDAEMAGEEDDRGGMQPLFYRRSVGFEVPSSGRECRCFICCGPRAQRKRPNDTGDRWTCGGRGEQITANKLMSRFVSVVFNTDKEIERIL